MRKLAVLAVVALMAIPAVTLAGPGAYNARGAFNGWGETLMTNNGDGTHAVTFNALAADTVFKFKVAEDLDAPNDWSNAFPKEDSYTKSSGAGSLTIVFDTNVIADGWRPASNRVKAPDTGLPWEVIGDFTGWDGGSPPGTLLAHQGGGLYSVDYTVASPGAHAYKFRAPGDWGRQVGDFSGSSNIEFSTVNPNQLVRFQLDIPNGRWQELFIPEPATLALLGLGGLALVRRRR